MQGIGEITALNLQMIQDVVSYLKILIFKPKQMFSNSEIEDVVLSVASKFVILKHINC